MNAMENRLKLKLAAMDDKFTKAFDKTSIRIEALRQAMQTQLKLGPTLAMHKGSLIATKSTRMYRSQSVLGKKRPISRSKSGSRLKKKMKPKPIAQTPVGINELSI